VLEYTSTLPIFQQVYQLWCLEINGNFTMKLTNTTNSISMSKQCNNFSATTICW
jgi:hypothetical protein